MKELTTLLSQEQAEKLQKLAKKNGKTTEEFSAELIERELKARTKPGNPRGNIRAFKRL